MALPARPTLRNFYSGVDRCTASKVYGADARLSWSQCHPEDKLSIAPTPEPVSQAQYRTPRTAEPGPEPEPVPPASTQRSEEAHVIYKCSAAISVAAREDRWKDAMQLLRDMVGSTELKDQTLCATSYQAVVGACARGLQWRHVMELVNEMRRLRVRLDPDSYSSAIRACEVLGRWEVALAFLQEMWKAPDICVVPNLQTYDSTIMVCSRNACWKQALELLREMPEVGLRCSTASYNGTIHACQKSDHWERAVELILEMWEVPDLGLLPDIQSYNDVLDVCGRKAQWTTALFLLRQMSEKCVIEDANSYAHVVSACSMAQQWESAVELLSEMQSPEVDLVPSISTYNAVLQSCAVVGQWEVAWHFFQEMPQKDVDSYNAALVACSKAESGKLWQVVVELLKERQRMFGRTSTFDKGSERVAYCAAIKACRTAGLAKRALALFQDMLLMHVAPDIHCCHTVLGIYKKGNRWLLALRLLRQMDRFYRIKPTVESYTSVMETCGGEWEVAISLLKEMRWRALEPNIPSRNAAIAACENGAAWDQALRVLKDTCPIHWQCNAVPTPAS